MLEIFTQQKIDMNFGKHQGGQSLLAPLDKIALDEEILLVSTGSTELINHYCHERLKAKKSSNLRWNILSSDYARYALLDRQKSLSDFIPTDTEIWLKNLLDHYKDSQILSATSSLGGIETFIIGESIIDEYIFCDALGKVSKECKRQALR